MFQTFLWLTGTFHCITALAVSVLIWYRVRYNPLKSFPGPRMTYPIFGVLAHLEKRNGSIKEMLERLREKYGRIRRIYLPFGKSRIEISDPKWIHYVMSTNSKNYNRGGKASLSVLKLVVGKSSLVMTSGALHKHLRTLANPAFRQVLLTEFLTIFSRVTERLTQVWDDQLSNSNNNKVEIFVRDYFARLTLDTIGLTAFGYDFKSFSPQSNDTTKAFHFMTRVKFSILQFLPGFNLMTRFIAYFSKYRGFSEISEFFYHIRKLREEIRSLIARKNNAKDNKSARNLLLILSEAEKDGKLTSEELEDMMMTLIAAGHDTSSVALTWLFYLLAKNPEIQEKCREETFQILSNDTDITWEQLMAHEYLLATIKETLRLYPPIPYVSRGAINDDIIDNKKVPAGCDLLINIFELQRDPEIWTNPDSFEPERFLDDKNPTCGYMPFGDGLHKCIGYQFATAEIALVASVLLRNYQFDVIEGDYYQERAVITLSPNPSLRLLVSRSCRKST